MRSLADYQDAPLYLDHAAATPMDERVFAAMQPYLRGNFYNPSANYSAARSVREALEAARHLIAMKLGAKSREIIFTSGGTEANNLAIQGVLAAWPGGTSIVSAVEHDSVLAPAGTSTVEYIPVGPDGIILLDQLEPMISDSTVLVSCMYANNEVGSVQPLRQLMETVTRIRARRLATGNLNPLYVHTDACQAANYLDLNVARLGIDLMTVNGSKIYGPKGSGILYVRTGVQLSPQLLGGGQEWGARSGTENVAGCVGLATALDIAITERTEHTRHAQQLRHQAFKAIQQLGDRVQINGSHTKRLPNNLHITIKNADNEVLLTKLDMAGIQCAAGSACSASSEEPSHVLRAMGLSESDMRGSLRITLGRSTTTQDIDYLISVLARVIPN